MKKRVPVEMTADWTPDPEKQKTIQGLYPHVNFELELRHFRAWWAIRRIKRVDWERSWLNWVRRCPVYGPSCPARGHGPSANAPSSIRAALERMPE